MTILAAFLLASTTVYVPAISAGTPADFIISVNDGEVPIHCSVNDQEMLITQDLIDTTEKQLALLKAHQFLSTITPEENQQLFEQELFLSALIQIKAAQNFATYFCQHPEALPKTVSGPTS